MTSCKGWESTLVCSLWGTVSLTVLLEFHTFGLEYGLRKLFTLKLWPLKVSIHTPSPPKEGLHWKDRLPKTKVWRSNNLFDDVSESLCAQRLWVTAVFCQGIKSVFPGTCFSPQVQTCLNMWCDHRRDNSRKCQQGYRVSVCVMLQRIDMLSLSAGSECDELLQRRHLGSHTQQKWHSCVLQYVQIKPLLICDELSRHIQMTKLFWLVFSFWHLSNKT